VKFKKGETVIYPQHGACVVQGTKKMEFFGEKQDYLILKTVINEMTLKVPISSTDEVGVRPPVSADELEDLVAVLAKPDPRVPSNWSGTSLLAIVTRRCRPPSAPCTSGPVST
jgi:CarD family transcriptional regulator